MSKSLSWRRVRALCVKETRQIVRDPSSWLIAVVIPLLLLFIFGYGINLDSSKLRVGILLEQQSQEALDFTHAMTGSPYIDATISDNRHELIEKMQAGRIRGLVVIPVDFAQQMARDGDSAPIQVITDGSEPNTANFVQGYVEGICKSGNSSGRKIAATPLNRSSTSRRATGLTRRRSVSILSFPGR